MAKKVKPLVVKSAVRDLLKGYRVGAGFFDALNKQVANLVAAAIKRAKANGRKTLRPEDL